MEPTYTGGKGLRRDGRDYSAEVTIRFLPVRGPTGVSYASEVERYFNSRFADDFAERSGPEIWDTVVKVLQAGEWRLAKRPELVANSFRAEVMRVRVSEGATAKDSAHLLAEASRLAAESYLGALNEGHVHLEPGDAEKPFEYQPSTGFDEEYIARRPCFLEYVAEKRRGFMVQFAVHQTMGIAKARAKTETSPGMAGTPLARRCSATFAVA